MEIQDIKKQLTLATVLNHYSLKPDKNLRLHCPFHTDKTPSMQVYYKTHTAYCFSSNCPTHGKSLDAIDFIMYKESCTKAQAIQQAIALCSTAAAVAAGRAESVPPPVAAKSSVSRSHFLGNMFVYFKNAVHNSRPAQQYLQQRCIDPLRIEVGYNTAQFHHGNRRDEAMISAAVACGLLSPWGTNTRDGSQAYKPFAKYCIAFALKDSSDAITGFYFRSTENNSDQKHYYLKDSTGLYPGYPNPATEKLIITESIIDAASLQQIKAITEQYSLLAAYGTNRLNEEMKAAIRQLTQLKEIVFAFDSDEAGNKAALKYKEELQAMLPAVTLSKMLLPCKDVNETLQAHNEEVFTGLLQARTNDFSFSTEKENARLFIEQTAAVKEQQPLAASVDKGELETLHPYKLRYTTPTASYYIQGGLPKSADNMKIMLVIEAAGSAAASISKARNRIDLYEDKQVERLCKEVAEKLDLRKDLLEADLYKLTDLLEQHIEKELQQQQSQAASSLPMLTIKERQELEGFAKKPKLIKRLSELLGKAGIIGEERNRIFLLVIAISHKMPETLHALIQGSSGSGKTRLLKQISDCIPKESVTKLTRLSDKVLYNFPEHYFINRLLCLEDIDGLSEEAEFAFRELQSNGELNSATSIKLENGQITSGQKTVKGPIASMACTTRGEVYEDNMSRVFLIAVDESIEQTRRIIEYQNSRAAGLIDSRKEQEAKAFIQKFITMLRPCEVVNPYANKIQLPEEAHKIRRLNDLFQSFVKMITIINQYQRKKDERGRLITESEDVEAAIHIMFESIVLKVDELDGSLRQFYEKLKAFVIKKGRGYEFSRFEIRESTGVSKTQQHHYISQLVQLEYIQQNGFANRGFRYKIVYWDNYTILRDRIKKHLSGQLAALTSEHHRTPGRTPETSTTPN